MFEVRIRVVLELVSIMFRILQSFPAWSDVDSNLDYAISTAAKALSQYDISHGEKYKEFISRQPETVKEVLERITQEIGKEREFIESHDAVIAKVREELTKLKPMNEKIKQDRKAAESVYAQAKKSENYYNEQFAKLEQIKLKSGENSADYKKQQDRVKAAETQKDKDELLMNQKKVEMRPIDYEYKKQFIECILNALLMFSESRSESSGQRSLIGAQVETLSEEIAQPEDTSLEKLESELAQLDQMTL